MATSSLTLVNNTLPQQISSLEYVTEPEEKYRCPECRSILQQPLQLSCGHHVCSTCIENLFIHGEPATCPRSTTEEPCPDLHMKDAFPDASVAKEIRNLKVYCPNKQHGCARIKKVKDIEKHTQNCEYHAVKCIYPGCQVLVTQQHLEEHQLVCPERPTECEKCLQKIPQSQLSDHEENYCQEALVPCPHKCSEPAMKRSTLKQHFEHCPCKPLACIYKDYGCTYTGTPEMMERHVQNDVGDHLNLVSTDMKEQETRSTITRAEKEKRTELMEDLTRKIASLGEQTKGLTIKLEGLSERVIIIERRVSELPRKDFFEEQARDVDNIKERITLFASQIRNLDGGDTVTRFGSLNVMSGEFSSQLTSQETQLDTHEVRLAKMELQYQLLETASYDGTIVWKISDYKRRKQDAVNGRTLSLYSQPFYSSKYGYKMCIRVYLNGDGLGQSSHVSLYFVVMKGEFDTLQRWAFGQKVTMFILDQGPSKRHISDHFIPDPTSTSFRRPTSEMNVASGCPLFVQQSMVENESSKYIQDDTMFIRCTVNPTIDA